jgi:hypothetical protein
LALNGLFCNDNPFLRDGNAKTADYVCRIEAEKKIVFDKTSRPSKYMIEKYGIKITAPVMEYDDAPLFQDHDAIEYNVGRVKPKKKTTKNRGPTEAEEERLERARRTKVECKHAECAEVEELKKSVIECRTASQMEDNKYGDALEELQHRKGMRNLAKDEMREKIISKHRDSIKNIKSKYPRVFQYVKTHKRNPNDLNSVCKHIRLHIAKL